MISFFITEAGLPVKVKSITDKYMRRLFGLSGACLEGVLLGLTGGYNTAVKCAVRLKADYPESVNQAKRVALFFTNPGISFTVLLVGATLSGSLLTGLRIYSEAVFYNLLIAYIYNKFNKLSDEIIVRKSEADISHSFVSAVKSATEVIISVSFNIIFFSCIICIIGNIFKSETIDRILILISEVSSAVIYSSEGCPFYITAGITVFGGICIFIQNLDDLKKLEVRPFHFILIRVIHSFLVGVTEYIYSLFFPDAVYTSAQYRVRLTSSDNASGTAALIFLCIIYLFAVRNIKSKGIRQRK